MINCQWLNDNSSLLESMPNIRFFLELTKRRGNKLRQDNP